MTFSWVRPALLSAAAVAATAAAVAASAKRTERDNPPRGKFIVVDGVRLHYIERGSGSPIVLLPGNSVTAEDFALSEVADGLQLRHRLFVFDRPGFGYSERPRSTVWDAAAQGRLLHAALRQLGVTRPVLVAHSSATLVALASALAHPAEIASVVLLSGYYFATPRFDAAIMAALTKPVVGDVLRYTSAPVFGRLFAPLTVRTMFAPSAVVARFRTVPFGLVLRPWQLRAEAEEAVLLAPSAASMQDRYHELAVPAFVLAGSDDRIVDTRANSERLASVLPRARLQIVPGAGHMLHHIAPREVLAAIEAAASPSSELPAVHDFAATL